MSTPNQSETQDDLSAVFEQIQEIVAKSSDGDYIYRGEPECHQEPPHCGKVSSSLWREYFSDVGPFYIEVVEKEMLSDAKRHIGNLPQNFRTDSVGVPNAAEANPEEAIDFELLTEIQHYAGKTNLIDFTTDYLIALFFACDGHHDKDGRVILQKTEKIRNMIKYPQNPQHRVIAQKSVFIYPPQGFIEPHENELVIIPAHLKELMLEHLRTYHGLSTETIYNDLHGFIRNQDIHGGAYTQFYKGLACQNRGDQKTIHEEKQKEYEESIQYYNEAIKLKSDFVVAYYNRGIAHNNKKEYGNALRDFNMAIHLNPNYAIAYTSRGITYNYKREYDNALWNFNMAIHLNPNDVIGYTNRGFAYNGKGEYNRAIWDFDMAIHLNPNYAIAYYGRGIAWLHMGEWEYAKSNLMVAKNLRLNIINMFHNSYGGVATFEQQYGIQLPPDITAMLTPQ